MTTPKSLIINSAYERPTKYWRSLEDNTLEIEEGRRSAGYEIFDARHNTRRTEELELVNKIRVRVDDWRDARYPGITSVTRKLLEHWQDREARQYPFYFCQLEAIETLIWWVEAAAQFKQGIFVHGDGGAWERLCNKMATGSGKTILMAMIITWQVLNALTYPRRKKDFSRAVFVVAPGLTVKGRLRVLYTGEPDNIYDEFGLCPSESMRQKLNQADILIENWHTLMPPKEITRSIIKKGRESDKAFTKRVLGKLSDHTDIIVINDEAHHAYRIPAELKISKKQAAEKGINLDEATRWIEGLDRIHNVRRIGRCFDLSATPFAPTGKKASDEGLFDWVISDFGLNDAIEAGLVKTPRVVIRDDALPDAKTYRSKLYHIYRDPEVSEDLNRKAEEHEALPKLIQDAYTLLGADWREAFKQWREIGHTSPPVMLTVCNRTETAARVTRYFNQGDNHWPELHEPKRTLRVDSKVLDKAEIGESSSSDKEYEEILREIVKSAKIPSTVKARILPLKKEELLREIIDNVGKRNTAGQDLQNVISVAMLSEGWDAKNVTHIMGLRAFSSQLLCEQVIGRGLRRVSYETDEKGLFLPEYVNIFGVPLSIFQDVGEEGDAPPPPKPSVQVESLVERNQYEIRWPNLLRVDEIVKPELVLDWEKVEPLTLDPAQTPISAEIAPALGGAADIEKAHKIDLEKLPGEFRLQKLIFKAARKAFENLQGRFTGNDEYLMIQLIRLVEEFLGSKKLSIPSLFHQDAIRKRILLALNIDLIVQHVLHYITEQNVTKIEPVFDQEMPIGSTRYMRTWYTTKPCQPTKKSQISHAVSDSTWEHYTVNALEDSDSVDSYAKNDHIGFMVHYLWKGSKRRFIPDYLIRLKNGCTLVLEIKGEDSPQNKAKREALDHWIKGVNAKGGFGSWCWDVAFQPAEVHDIIARHLSKPNSNATATTLPW